MKQTHDDRVLALLADGKPHTHHELYALGVIAHSRAASLRKKGYTIPTWREGDDYLYQLTGSPLREPSVVADRAGGAVLRETNTDGSLSGGGIDGLPPGLSNGDDTAAAAVQLTVFDALGVAA